MGTEIDASPWLSREPLPTTMRLFGSSRREPEGAKRYVRLGKRGGKEPDSSRRSSQVEDEIVADAWDRSPGKLAGVIDIEAVMTKVPHPRVEVAIAIQVI